MRKFYYFSITLFLLTILFWITLYIFALGFCWSPSAQCGASCFTADSLVLFAPLLITVLAWMIFIKAERSRGDLKTRFLPILNVAIGIVISFFVVWSSLNIWPTWRLDFRSQLRCLQGLLPYEEMTFCTKDSDCPAGQVCTGRGPAKPSSEIPGVCVSQKQLQGVQ